MEENYKKLEDMIGGYYRHEGKRKMVRDVKVKGDIATIITDLGDIQIHIDDLDNELQAWLKIKENVLVKNEALTDIVLSNSSMYNQLTLTLLSTIEKIQNDPGYINQAEAINNTVKSAIELEKVKIATLALLK